MIAVFLVIVGANVVHAQLNVSAGPNIGAGHTWLRGEGKSRFQPAANFGISLIHSANDHVGIGLDLKYSIEGGAKKVSGLTNNNDLRYLRIPVKAIYFFNEYGDAIRPKVSLGPSMGVLLGGKTTLGSAEFASKDIFKTLDFGLAANAGVHVRMISGTWLTFDLNYYHGLSDVSSSVNSVFRNRNLQVNAGLMIGFAKSN